MAPNGHAMTPERYRRLREVLDRRQPDLTVFMERVHKPHNFSAILRNCDAAGVLEVHAVPPEGGLPLHHRTAAGAEKWVRVHRHGDTGSAVEHLREREFRILAAHPGEEAADYRTVDLTRPTAIMVGAERDGLSDEGLEAADQRVAIPMSGMVRSLNVSVATSLLLFEAARQREDAGMYDGPRLDRDRYENLLFEWAYPRVALKLRELGEPYPGLNEEGEIVWAPRGS